MREGADRDQGGDGSVQRQASRRGLPTRKLLLKVLATVIFVVALGIGSFFLFLSRGPIDLSWLAPEIVASLYELSGGKYAYKLAGASIVNSNMGQHCLLMALLFNLRDILSLQRLVRSCRLIMQRC